VNSKGIGTATNVADALFDLTKGSTLSQIDKRVDVEERMFLIPAKILLTSPIDLSRFAANLGNVCSSQS
jgi:hypothetical protein